MRTISVDVDIDISSFLEELTDEELLQELSERDSEPFGHDSTVLLEKIYLLRRSEKDYQQELDDLIYTVLGKIS